jgi:ribosome maturation protein SDO1
VEKAFGTSNETAILSEILQKGELQVGEKEREAALGKMRKEIASSLAGMSVNPGTMRPYPVTIIEKVMKVRTPGAKGAC